MRLLKCGLFASNSLTGCWVYSTSPAEFPLGMGPQCQAVLLAGGTGASLFPLNHTGNPLALFPVANQPLITYALHTLEQAGVLDVLVVSTLQLAHGNTYAKAFASKTLSVSAYVLQNSPYSTSGILSCRSVWVRPLQPKSWLG